MGIIVRGRNGCLHSIFSSVASYYIFEDSLKGAKKLEM